MPSKALLETSWKIAAACASRDAGVASIVSTAEALKLLLTTFWIVGSSALPVIAARHVLFSAFQFLAIVPSAFQLYQTGFDSLTVPPFVWIDVSALWSHGGIHAVMRYEAKACAAKGSTNAGTTAGRGIRTNAPFGDPRRIHVREPGRRRFRPEALRPPVAGS